MKSPHRESADMRRFFNLLSACQMARSKPERAGHAGEGVEGLGNASVLSLPRSQRRRDRANDLPLAGKRAYRGQGR
jgi:hypothetical protein